MIFISPSSICEIRKRLNAFGRELHKLFFSYLASICSGSVEEIGLIFGVGGDPVGAGVGPGVDPVGAGVYPVGVGVGCGDRSSRSGGRSGMSGVWQGRVGL